MSNYALNAMLDSAGLNALLSGALLRLYSGTQPASPQAAATGTLLGTVTFGNPAGVVANRVLTIGATTPDSDADANGTAGWGRLFASNGVDVIMDGDCGLSNADFILDDVNILEHGSIVLAAMTITFPASSE